MQLHQTELPISQKVSGINSKGKIRVVMDPNMVVRNSINRPFLVVHLAGVMNNPLMLLHHQLQLLLLLILLMVLLAMNIVHHHQLLLLQVQLHLVDLMEQSDLMITTNELRQSHRCVDGVNLKETRLHRTGLLDLSKEDLQVMIQHLIDRHMEVQQLVMPIMDDMVMTEMIMVDLLLDLPINGVVHRQVMELLLLLLLNMVVVLLLVLLCSKGRHHHLRLLLLLPMHLLLPTTIDWSKRKKYSNSWLLSSRVLWLVLLQDRPQLRLQLQQLRHLLLLLLPRLLLYLPTLLHFLPWHRTTQPKSKSASDITSTVLIDEQKI